MSEPVDESEWLVAAPGAGEITLAVGVGEGAELTDRARQAIEELLDALHDAEVSGFAFGAPTVRFNGFNITGPLNLTGGSTCGKLICGGHSCGQLSCDDYKSAYV